MSAIREWSQPVDATPNGRQFVTLKDAADYILALPAKSSAKEHWQLAMQMLIDAADRGGIVMLARSRCCRR
jgi:hypothetical protein